MFEYTSKFSNVMGAICLVMLLIFVISMIVYLCLEKIYYFTPNKVKYFAGWITVLSLIMFFVFGLSYDLFGGNKDVNLKELDSVIHVDNNKVTIDKLPSQYSYKEINYDDRFSKDSTNIFKFETVDFYETSYLIGEDGTKIKLNVDETKYLKEKGAK